MTKYNIKISKLCLFAWIFGSLFLLIMDLLLQFYFKNINLTIFIIILISSFICLIIPLQISLVNYEITPKGIKITAMFRTKGFIDFKEIEKIEDSSFLKAPVQNLKYLFKGRLAVSLANGSEIAPGQKPLIIHTNRKRAGIKLSFIVNPTNKEKFLKELKSYKKSL